MSKCTSVWDVGAVVTFLQDKMGNNLVLDLKQILLKTTMLLPLANTPRASDLVVLDVQFYQG